MVNGLLRYVFFVSKFFIRSFLKAFTVGIPKVTLRHLPTNEPQDLSDAGNMGGGETQEEEEEIVHSKYVVGCDGEFSL